MIGSSTDSAGASAHPTTPLVAWQQRLDDHFGRLATERKASDWPLFALEHGLSAAERDALARDVRAVTVLGPPSRDFPLPWIVYAAEIGYEYEGEKYWPVFKEYTPGWDDQWRDYVRRRFMQFAAKYNGAIPEGAWAGHFSIIAWPITHGILPRDLQRQLAELLYYARTTFRSETFRSAEALGRHLEANSHHSSSRFRKFAENTTLLGQIALALLLQETDSPIGTANAATNPPSDVSRLHPATLARITADLSRERDAGEWLNEARSAARYRVRGVARIPLRSAGVQDRASGRQADRSEAIADQNLLSAVPRHRFVLRETSPHEWQVRLHFPNLAPLLDQIPHARDVLMRAQGRVTPPRGPLLARGRIVTEQWPGLTLSEWPKPGAMLLTFEQAPPELRAFLETSFRAPSGGRWLFAIGADGQAREQGARVLRPGASYLLLGPTRTNNPAGGLIPVGLSCTGVFGLRIDVPDAISESFAAVLEILGLEVAQTLDVWPAGLPVAEWTGDGSAEWLVGDAITLGVRADRRITELSVGIDDAPTVCLPPGENGTGNVAFVTVPPLEEGRHQIVLRVRGPNAQSFQEEPGDERALEGALEVLVRPPRGSARDGTGVLSLLTQPQAPSLEDVWDGRCEFYVSAPGAATMRCRVTLTAKGKTEPLVHRQLHGLPIPLDTATWRDAFEHRVRDAASEHYDEAHACVLQFDAGALGQARIVAERDFTPLRWAVRDGGRVAALIDSGGGAGLEIHAYACDSPDIPRQLAPVEVAAGVSLELAGALLWARSGGAVSAVVAIPSQRVDSLAALSRRPHVAACAREVGPIGRLIRVAAAWERARLAANPLAASRRRDAVNALLACAFESIAGGRWRTAETNARSVVESVNGNSNQSTDRAWRAVETLRGLISERPDERGLAPAIALKSPDLAKASAAEREAAFREHVSAFVHSVDADRAASFAIRLSTSPSAAIAWTLAKSGNASSSVTLTTREGALESAINMLLSAPVVLRAARFFTLCLDAGGAQSWSSW